MPVQIRWKAVSRLGVSAALTLAGTVVCSRAQSVRLDQGIAAELQSLTAHAGTIFVGQITSIERKGSIVEVTFRVEQPVSGAAAESYVLREWAGLWPAGHFRYTVGQRVLAFLHTSSAAGFSSPVHGAEGLVPVVVQGVNAPRMLDVRRVAASVVRERNTPLPTEADGGILLADALGVISAQTGASEAAPGRLPVPTRGKPPVDLPRSRGRRYPVAEPVEPLPRAPLRMPAASGVSFDLR